MKIFLNIFLTLLSLHDVEGYLVSPPGTPAPGAAEGCSAWVESSYSLTCDIVSRFYGMSLAQFEAWNPTVGDVGRGCNMIEGLCYCVQVDFVTLTTLSTPTISKSATTPTTILTTPSKSTSKPPGTISTTSKTTTPGNGVSTPTPIQPGMTGSCNKFHLVVSGDTCSNIATAQGISLDSFYTWNPTVGNKCASLWAGYYVCVGITGSGTTKPPPTTTKGGNGVVTPTPTQTGMTTKCKAFHLVVSGDICQNIASAAGISLANFYDWNPAVGKTCASLWAGYYICIKLL